MSAVRCPSPGDLEAARDGRGAAEGEPHRDQTIARHVQGCVACSASWAELDELRALARAIPVERWTVARRQTHEERLLRAFDQAGELRGDERGAELDAELHAEREGDASEVSGGRPSGAPWRSFGWGAAIAAAVVLAFLAGLASPRVVGGLLTSSSRGEPTLGQARLLLEPRPGAVYELGGSQADPGVRLFDGTLRVEVGGLAEGQRLRVVTADGEVEARGTRFEVVARGDRLVRVQVARGRLEVRRQGQVRVLRQHEALDVQVELTRSTPAFAGAASALATGPSAALTVPLHDGPSAPTAPVRVAAALAPPAPAAAAASVLAPAAPAAPAPAAPAARAARAPEPAPEPAAPAEAPAALPEPPAAPPPAPAAPSPPAPFSDALAAFSRGEFARAARQFAAESVRRDSPLREDAAFWEGVAWVRAQDRTRAIATLRRFLRQHAGSRRESEVHTALGWQLLEGGQPVEAREHFQVGLQSPVPAVSRSARAGLAATDRQRRPAPARRP